ncbi:MAG: hypothetical protein COW00_11600 [Bdellovibrio sp. CG12_big_fil_rev_8_21_14_0_65_39_13]|nr:MAG: hypothetical protein COW78_04720 [Bdellovibrio sp. CG22_combo_CG10-13_8_21_14_all_39_27]PIQ59366.1 MAG: hypothetical protein COW00_11600 [Bdellovibrio sp. CG12_big_fil_rev_8_21_14_0_65_39_13]PIR32787.1 MAG: hypothetical protein COV37_18855 [Bdellovibrio sp. CG11_big_fil_rev_8_21_14_0_20_39_38]
MSATDYKTQLWHLVLRAPKEESAFIYFQLESNEGLAFYSTLDSSLNAEYRDIELHSPISLKPEVEQFLSYLESKISLERIVDEVIEDTAHIKGHQN